MTKFVCVIFSMIMIVETCQSKEFCVTNSQELQEALSQASDTFLEGHHIKISEGSYPIPEGGFKFRSADYTHQNFLKISGGWSYFFGNPCGQQYRRTPMNTILDGKNQGRVLHLEPALRLNIDISHLMILNGKAPEGEIGGGLLIGLTMNTESGLVELRNNAFISNEADYASAFYLEGTRKTILKNNVFAGNESQYGAAIKIKMPDTPYTEGVYVLNNTILNNTSSIKDPFTASGLDINIISNAQQVLVANNILWGNGQHDLKVHGLGYSYLFNNIINSSIGIFDETQDNISQPPIFANGGFLQYAPAAQSPAVNNGWYDPVYPPNNPTFSQNWHPTETDIDGQPRLSPEGQLDIGANEYWEDKNPFFNH